MSLDHLQTDKPVLSWDIWLEQLKKTASIETKMPIADIKINEESAREWYNDGFTPYATFRETWNQ